MIGSAKQQGTNVMVYNESGGFMFNKTGNLVGYTSNTVTVNIPRLADKIVIREDADIDRLVSKLSDKLEKVSMNVGNSDIGYAYQV